MDPLGVPRPRVLYILSDYPQISQTYIQSEIRAVSEDYEVRVVARNLPDVARASAYPHEVVKDSRRMDEIVREFRPDILHTHYLTNTELVLDLARRHDLAFTVRAHSFDVLIASTKPKKLRAKQESMRRSARLLNDERCLGVLSFPFTRPILEQAGCRPDRIIECNPVVDFDRFFTPAAPESTDVMNVGACLEKKRLQDFVDLAVVVPGRRFDLYPIGYLTDVVRAYNEERGSPVRLHEVVQPEDMPAVYRAHGWLVYTACPTLKSVGWPLAVAEAQAAGLGVCVPRIRPDLAAYLGGGGFLYDSIHELPRILAQPVPQEMRELGWEQARKSDILRHRHLLTDLWQDRIPIGARRSSESRTPAS